MLLSETSVPGTDDWFLMRLAVQYGAGLPRLGRLRSYMDGTSALPSEASQAMRESYRRFLRMHRLNVGELAVDARVNRMKPIGFRTAAAGDDFGDATAMRIWKRSNLKVGSRDLFHDAALYGQAFTVNSGPQVPSPDADPRIVPRGPWAMTSFQDPAEPWLSEAALMVGYDPINGVDILTLFRPGYMRQAFRRARVSAIPTNGNVWLPGRGWEWVSDAVPLGFTQKNPVTQLAMKDGRGVFEAHTDTLDRINNTILERSTLIAMQAFRQMAIEGKLPERYPAFHERAGEKIDYDDLYKAGPGSLWMLPEGAKIWESGVTDITPILGATKQDVQHFAAVTSTPLYILQPDAANGSAEGASLAREGLVFAVEEMDDRADGTLALGLSMGFEALGDIERASIEDIETIWAPPDRSSITERASASAQAKAGGMSQRMINEKIFQLTPAEMAREEQYKQDEAFLAPAAGA
jgi:hypothetical protein